MKAICTIQNFAKRLVMMLAIGLMAVNAWGVSYTATYTVASKTSVSKTGDAPSGSSATFSQSGNNDAGQMTANGTTTLILSGYDGKKIKAISLYIRKTSGTKTAAVTASTGDTQFCNYTIGSSNLPTSLGTRTVSLNSTPIIADDATITIGIKASANSVYISKYNITWEDAIPYDVSFNTGTGNPSVATRRGAVITLPDDEDLTPTCSDDGWTLYGWATEAYGSASTTSAPSSTFVGYPGETYEPSDDITLYAVYAKVATDVSASPQTLSFAYSSSSTIWKKNHYTDKSTYWLIHGTNGYIESPIMLDLSKITSIVVQAGYFGGSAYGEFQLSGNGTDYGSEQICSNSTESTSYTVNPSPNPLSGKGRIKLQATGTASDANGVRVKTITINYTAPPTYYWSAPTCASCGSNPTVTAASNNGSITSTQIPVRCASGISNIGGAGCSLTSYGFVWAPSATTTTPTLDNSNHEVGTSIAASTAFNYTITGLTPNTEYAIRPYATNGHGTAYGSAYTVTTLQRYTISYNNNGGSGSMASSTKDHGVAFALPANAGTMTKTGYHIKQWRLNSAGGTAYPLSGSYTTDANATFYVDWEANTYTVTLNGNGATGAGSPSTVTATYNSNTLSSAITNPTKTDYIFGGWNTKDDGTGLTVIDASGNLVASQSGYTDASKNWIKDGGVTLYAKWTEHTYTNYRTVCCTEMGTINNSLSLTQGGNSVTISGWTYNDASSTKPAESNLASYTVRMYKKNGASWDLVSGTATGGSAGTAGTRTGIATNSKSVTFTGLVVESEYKFTIEGIGATGYCDIDETEITSINSTDVSSTPFKFRYSIYIDNGSNSGWAHHYIEPTGNTDEGSVSITLGAHVDYYQFKIAGGFSGWWGQSGSSKIPANTQWTLNSDQNVRLETGAGGAYVFTIDYSGTTNPKVTVTFPSADQDADYKIYFDKSAVADWGSTLKYRIGNGSHNQNQNFTLVPGTDQFYVTTTPDYGSMDAWQIANNVAWDGSHSIYNYHNGDGYDITRATVFQDYAVDEDITIVPTSIHNTENSCQFWDVSKTSGMLTHTATITTPSHGTINIAYTDVSGTSQPTNTSTVADLAHRTILTITATPATGYSLTSLTVDGDDFTSGDEFILNDDATIEATFTAQTSTVTLDNNSATSGSQQTVTATYDASMPLKTTADGTPAVAALTRTGYTFNGWWDNTSGGNQYYTYNSGTGVIASARTWDKTGAQTLKAQWTVNQYTLTWDLQGGTVATAGTGAAAAATGTPSSDQDYGTALTAPIVTKTGYNFNVWSPSVAGTMPAANTTYTASWTAQVYNITYKDQGDNAYSGNATTGVPTGAPTTHTYGSATALVNGVKDGYRFDGWFTDASCTVSAGSSIGATAKTADFTLYAKWTQVYTVTWHVNGSTYNTGVVDGNSHVVSGGKISACPTAPADNTLSSCADKFMGWSEKNAGATAKTTSYYDDLFTDVAGSPTINANKDFYAVFAEVPDEKYWSMGTITTIEDGATMSYANCDGAHTVTGSDGNDYTYTSSNVMNSSGNQFRGSSYCGRIYNTTTLGRITKIELVAGSYVSEMKVYESASSITASPGSGAITPSVDGSKYTYEFTGKGFFLIIQEGSHAAKANVTVYFGDAPSNYRTQCDANMVKVTYDANGGSTTCAGGTHDKRNDYTVCSSAPTRDYYTFAGWLCSADSKTYAASATIDDAVIDADFTLTAQWTPVPYSITYELYGGTNSGSNPATYNVTTATITLQDPTKGHDRFEGWYSTYSAGVYSDPVTEIPLGSHGNITLYAKWTERHEIVFDYTESASSGTTTIYRADDENLEDAVAGMGSVPDDPDAPSACSSKVFVGWSESTIDDETNTRPSDLMKPAAGTVDEDKHYYAVWATSTSGSKTLVMEITRADFDDSYHSGAEQSHTSTAVANDGSGATLSVSWKSVNVGDFSSKIQVKDASGAGFWNTTDLGSISSVSITTGNNITHFENTSVHPTSTSGTTKGYFTVTKSGGTGTATKVTVTFTKTVSYYIAYSTSCCATKVTLTQNDPEHGTIAFGKTTVGTCGDKEVSLTITPAAGYQLHSYEVATGSGKVGTKSVSPAISLDNNSSAAQNITLTFADEANGAYDVTASFSLMTVTSWTWTMHDGGGAIPDPLNLYVGQSARLDVAYTPAGVDNSKKTYTRDKDNTYINWVGSVYAGYSTIEGRASTGENTTAVTFTHADGPTKTVNVKVLPLPLTHFEDLVHGKSFDDVVATIADNALSATKTTPTSDDWTTPNANDCEENHLHLVGWIREDWPALVAYLNGTGDAPTTTAIVGAGNDGSGHAYYIAAGASINVQTFDGVTFYAVWAEIK